MTSAAAEEPAALYDTIRACRICRDAPVGPPLPVTPNPVLALSGRARLLIAGQAPGARVHASGRPFTDPSGDRLRDWLGLDDATFYDRDRVAIVPMAFCFPGYDARKADLPPPPLCAATWHGQVMQALPGVRLKVLVGAHAIRWHLGAKAPLTGVVKGWRDHWPDVMPLPHPSWRNTAWLKRNPWFGDEVLPVLRARVREVLS